MPIEECVKQANQHESEMSQETKDGITLKNTLLFNKLDKAKTGKLSIN